MRDSSRQGIRLRSRRCNVGLILGSEEGQTSGRSRVSVTARHSWRNTHLSKRNSLSWLARSLLPHQALSELMKPLGNSLACDSSISTCSEGDKGGSPISSFPADNEEREEVAVLFCVAKAAVMVAVVV